VDALAAADIVISHAGTGSALANVAAGRFAVVASRSAEFGEAGDDHQRQLADELAARGLALHRHPTEIAVDDLVGTLSASVRRVSDVPLFELRS
jgi:UDP-N-acetylglucosamine--N-acetylmuramyl-(pentapeptide) pyrophosphoryl-undecaprenol N-acetylglucosamine transferase